MPFVFLTASTDRDNELKDRTIVRRAIACVGHHQKYKSDAGVALSNRAKIAGRASVPWKPRLSSSMLRPFIRPRQPARNVRGRSLVRRHRAVQ
jgi:hypothetical protein